RVFHYTWNAGLRTYGHSNGAGAAQRPAGVGRSQPLTGYVSDFRMARLPYCRQASYLAATLRGQCFIADGRGSNDASFAPSLIPGLSIMKNVASETEKVAMKAIENRKIGTQSCGNRLTGIQCQR